MPSISVELFRSDDPGPRIPDDAISLATMGEEPWQAILIEGGMASGQHAVPISIPIGDGKVAVHQTSLLALRAAVRSLEGMAETQLGWVLPA